MANTTRWLVYLRFDVAGAVETFHIAANGRDSWRILVNRARRRPPTPGAQLVEYASFGALRNIHPYEVPNFHFFTEAEFLQRTGGPATPEDLALPGPV